MRASGSGSGTAVAARHALGAGASREPAAHRNDDALAMLAGDHAADAAGHTKLDVVRYHERVGRWLLPQLAPRPIAVVRCTDGRLHEAAAAGCAGEADDDPPPFTRVSDVADIVRAVQNDAYEFRTWGSSFPRLERPDRITLDLDADPGLPWPAMQDAADRLRTLLALLDLCGFVKTTGGDALHVVVPLTRRHSWIECSTVARGIAECLARSAPTLCTVSGAARDARVRVGHRLNVEGAAVVAAYSLRARPGLPVSMPIAWDDLAGGDVRGDFTIDTAEREIARRDADPWADYDRSRRTISASMRRTLAG
jgi:bifunctional non-homologous end joining protein LigD